MFCACPVTERPDDGNAFRTCHRSCGLCRVFPRKVHIKDNANSYLKCRSDTALHLCSHVQSVIMHNIQ